MNESDIIQAELEVKGWSVLRHGWPGLFMVRKGNDLMALEIDSRLRPLSQAQLAMMQTLHNSGIRAKVVYHTTLNKPAQRLSAIERKAHIRRNLRDYSKDQGIKTFEK